MFGFFKKKAIDTDALSIPSVDDHTAHIAAVAGKMIELQLLLVRSEPNLHEQITTNRARGYMIGFFDCAAQKSALTLPNDEAFFAFLIACHAALPVAIFPDPVKFTFASLRLQDDPEFSAGQVLGGSEYDDMMTNGNSRQLGLCNIIRPIKTIDRK